MLVSPRASTSASLLLASSLLSCGFASGFASWGLCPSLTPLSLTALGTNISKIKTEACVERKEGVEADAARSACAQTFELRQSRLLNHELHPYITN